MYPIYAHDEISIFDILEHIREYGKTPIKRRMETDKICQGWGMRWVIFFIYIPTSSLLYKPKSKSPREGGAATTVLELAYPALEAIYFPAQEFLSLG